MKTLLALPLVLATCGLDVSPSESFTRTGGGAGGGGQPGTTIFFSFDILPLFQEDCITCHGGAGGLDLQSWAGLITGGDSGAVVVPFAPDQSLLIRRLDGTKPPRMPLDRPPLTSPEIDRVRQWILEGAQDN